MKIPFQGNQRVLPQGGNTTNIGLAAQNPGAKVLDAIASITNNMAVQQRTAKVNTESSRILSELSVASAKDELSLQGEIDPEAFKAGMSTLAQNRIKDIRDNTDPSVLANIENKLVEYEARSAIKAEKGSFTRLNAKINSDIDESKRELTETPAGSIGEVINRANLVEKQLNDAVGAGAKKEVSARAELDNFESELFNTHLENISTRFLEEALAEPDLIPSFIEQYNESIDEAAKRNVIDNPNKAKREFKEAINLNNFNRELGEGGVDQAKTLLSTLSNSQKITANELIEKKEKQVIKEQEKKVSDAQDANHLDAKQFILENGLSGEGLDAYIENQKDVGAGFGQKNLVSILSFAEGRKDKQKVKDKAQIEIKAITENGGFLNPSLKDHREHAQEMYNGTDKTVESLVAVSTQLSIVPSEFKEQTRTAFLSGDVESIVDVADKVEALRKSDPELYSQLPQERKKLTELNQLTRAGLDPQKALDLIKEKSSRTTEEINLIKANYNTEIKALDQASKANASTSSTGNKNYLKEKINDDFGGSSAGLIKGLFTKDKVSVKGVELFGATAAKNIIKGELFGELFNKEDISLSPNTSSSFDALVRAHYEGMAVPDIKLARELAYDDIRVTTEIDKSLPKAPALRFKTSDIVERSKRDFANKIEGLSDEEIKQEAKNIQETSAPLIEKYNQIKADVKSGKNVDFKEAESIFNELQKQEGKAEIISNNSNHKGFFDNLDFGSWRDGGLAGIVRWGFRRATENKEDEIHAGLRQSIVNDLDKSSGKDKKIIQEQLNDLDDNWQNMMVERYYDFNQLANKEDEDFDYGALWTAAKDNPGGMAANMVNALIADPQYALIPMGALRTAALGAQVTAGMTKGVVRLTTITSGAVGASSLGAVTELPISMARQLGENDFISESRTKQEVGFVAVAAPLFAGTLFAVTTGLPRLMKANPKAEAKITQSIEDGLVEGKTLKQSVSQAFEGMGLKDDIPAALKEVDNLKPNDPLMALLKSTDEGFDLKNPTKKKGTIDFELVKPEKIEPTTSKGASEPKDTTGIIEYYKGIDVEGYKLESPDQVAARTNVWDNGINFVRETDEIIPGAGKVKVREELKLTEKNVIDSWENLKLVEYKDLVPESAFVKGNDISLSGTRTSLGKTTPFSKQTGNVDPKLAGAMTVIGIGALVGGKDDGVQGAVEGAALVGVGLAIGVTGLRLTKAMSAKAKVALSKPINFDHLFQKRRGDIAVAQRHNWVLKESIIEAIPDKARREAITHHLDGDTTVKLTPDELKMAKELRGFTDHVFNFGNKEGVLTSYLENYVPHMWKRGTGSVKDAIERLSRRSQSTTTGHNKQRSIPTLKEGIELGLEPATLDIAEIVRLYGNAMHQTVANKRLVTTLQNTVLSDGTKLMVDAADAPSSYVAIDHPSLKGQAIHPDLKFPVKAVFESFDPNIWFRSALALNFTSKRMLVSMSAFHANALVESAIYSGNPNVFNNMRYADLLRTGKAGDLVDQALRSGLMLGTIDDVGTDAFYGAIDTVRKTADRLSPLTKLAIGKPLQGFEKANRFVDHIMWDRIATGSKLAVFAAEVEKALLNPANKDIPIDKLKRQVAQSVNDMFGGQEWTGVAEAFESRIARELAFTATSKVGRAFGQLLMFAPDWTTSNLRVLGKAIPGITENPQISKLHQYYAYRGAAFFAIAGSAVNMIYTGKPIWENKDPTMIDLGNGQRMTFSKQFVEPFHWADDPWKTALNKGGIIPKAAASQALNKQYISVHGAPSIFDEDDSFGERSLKRLGHAAQNFEPIFIQQLHENGTREGVSGFAGHPIYGKKQ